MNFNAKSVWLFICGLLGATAVALGAVAAHALTDPQAALSVQRASNYQLFHVVAILVLLGMQGRLVCLARLLMLAGVIGFSGAIYAKYLLDLPALGTLAPVGGSLLIVSWIVLAVSAITGSRSRDSSSGND
jgi:uncharacterized membrane protein YgdD (TMEM256/DUF423 family)